MKNQQVKQEAVATADAYLNNVSLPNYTTLAQAASALACNHDSLELRRKLNYLLDQIPVENV